MEDLKKKRIFRTIIIVLIGGFILWQISSVLINRNRLKEDAKEIMKFMEESEENTQKSFD